MVHVPAEVDRFSRLIRRIRPRAAGSIHGRGVAQAPGAHMNTCWAPDWLAIAYHEQTSSYSPPGCSRARWARWNTGKTLRSKPRKRGVVQRNAFSVFPDFHGASEFFCKLLIFNLAIARFGVPIVKLAHVCAKEAQSIGVCECSDNRQI